MKKNYLLLLVFLFTINIIAQNKIMPKEGTYQFTKVFEKNLTKKVVLENFTKENNLDENYTFVTKIVNTDKFGNTHERYSQYYKGIKIQFGEIITHSDADNFITSINGEIYKVGNLNLNPTLSSVQVLQTVLLTKTSTKYLWDDKESAASLNYQKPTGKLVLFPNVRSGEVKLAYLFDIYSLTPLYRDEVYADANTGEILYSNPVIKHAQRSISNRLELEKAKETSALVTGNAATKYSGARNIETTLNAITSKYVLNDVTRGNGIVTYNCQRTNTYPSTNFSDTDNNWTAIEHANFNKDNGALDAHWGAEMTYDFWSTVFGRSSYDNLGTQLKSYIHYSQNPPAGYANAFWNGSVMTYGDGAGSVNILTSLDVCAHEIGHAVCSSTADLVYQNQSGGINEGFSDIWGACIEQYGRNNGNLNVLPPAASNIWKIAEDLSTTGNPFRSMSNPLSKGDPDTFKGTSYKTTADDGNCVPSQANDYCGVHSNSGVLNHWFFILTSGKSGTNNAPAPDTYSVTGIGMQKSAEIAFLTERDYLTPNATFADTREASINVAKAIYCPNSPEVIAVTNAWYAVNVGEQYVARANDVAAIKLNSELNAGCNTTYSPVLKFQNSGSNVINTVAISYTIDGATPVNTTWTGTINPCESINFPLTVGALTVGTHTIVATTTLSNDEDITNNSKTAFFTVNASGTVNNINTFENPIDNLVTFDSDNTNTVWERGNLANKLVLTDAVAGNSKVYATKLNGNYPDLKKSYLVSKCYNLTTIASPIVKFDMGFDLETDWDIIYVQYTTNNGTSWTNLGTGTSPTWYTSDRLPNGTDCFNCIGGQWTGIGNAANPQGNLNKNRRTYSYNLSSLATQSNIIFRIVLHSDESVANEGAFIDDFVVTGTLATSDNNFETFNIFPNPSNGLVTIQLSTTDKVAISLYDIGGRNVYNKTFNNTSALFDQDISLTNLQQGVYLLTIETDGKKATKKLIIK